MQFRLTEVEKNFVAAQAHAAGMTLSDYCRRRVLGYRVVADADQTMIRNLRQLGGLLKHIHLETKGIYSERTAEILEKILEYIEGLLKR